MKTGSGKGDLVHSAVLACYRDFAIRGMKGESLTPGEPVPPGGKL